VKHVADEEHKSIDTLQSSSAELKQKISDLSAKREAVLAELKQVEEALTQAKQEESQLPDKIKDFQQDVTPKKFAFKLIGFNWIYLRIFLSIQLSE